MNTKQEPQKVIAIVQSPLPSQNEKSLIKDFLRSFLMPTFVGKTLVLYFGLMYSNYPDEGYGYGLIAAILFTLISLMLFIYKYRNYED